MKMLGKFWRLRMINATGQIMDFDAGAEIAIRLMPWKITSGEYEYRSTVITEDLQFSTSETIAIDGEVESLVIDNSSDLYFGVAGTFEVTHDDADASGDCKLYLEWSDTNGNWPSDANDFVITDLILLVTLPIANTGTVKSRSVNFEI